MEPRTGRAGCKATLGFFITCTSLEGHLYSFPSASPHVMWHIQIQALREAACGPQCCLWSSVLPVAGSSTPRSASGSPPRLQISVPWSGSALIRSNKLVLVFPHARPVYLSLSGFTPWPASTCVRLDMSCSLSHMIACLFLTGACCKRYCQKKRKPSPILTPSYIPCESQGSNLPCPVGR